MKLIYFTIGIIGIVLTITALILPVIPATPFILLALFGLSNSSKRVHDYFIALPLIKPLHQSLLLHHTFTPKQKLVLSLLMLPTALVPLLFVSNTWAKLSAVVFSVGCIVFIWAFRYKPRKRSL